MSCPERQLSKPRPTPGADAVERLRAALLALILAAVGVLSAVVETG